MVIPISNSGAAKIDAQRISTAPIILVEDKRDRKIEGNGTPAARFARLGPPIDVNRVNEIRAAIAGGSYTVDADRLAAAMLALDLPEKAK
jgi:anti-sigma28 factor (negative regulator of flagellin synthesis)